jgi:hypothetical protein
MSLLSLQMRPRRYSLSMTERSPGVTVSRAALHRGGLGCLQLLFLLLLAYMWPLTRCTALSHAPVGHGEHSIGVCQNPLAQVHVMPDWSGVK